MAHVLNRQERSQAFWKFLFFFVISTALVVGAVYFDVRIPSKNIALLNEQVFHFKSQEIEQQNFAKKTDDAKQLIESLTKNDVNINDLKQEIAKKIVELDDLQSKDSSIYSQMNSNVVEVIRLYRTANEDKVDLKASLQNCNNLKESYKTELDRLKNSNTQPVGLGNPQSDH